MSAATAFAEIAAEFAEFAAASVPDSTPQKGAVRRQIPCQRNRDVFAAVAMGNSHAEAAKEFGLTQPRVTQIVRQVREWCSQVDGGEYGKYNEVQRLRLAEETLRVQLDGWLRMAMVEWRRSRKEGLGRATYLNAASRLGSNLARLAGVDVSGKTARIKAEQQAKEEADLLRARAAEKPLWAEEPSYRQCVESRKELSTPTLAPATVYNEQPTAGPAGAVLIASIKNSYRPATSATASDVTQSIKDRFTPQNPPVSMPHADKPIPKFLDKKVRKRLLALRRQESRAEALGAVG